ncbi:MAG: thiol reductase thioredoxin [Phycisphaeraceae bacterium]|nr:thiol reductase thioredoxin [Phycisphaeraceae bacterium]|tara:strand:- start:683 stop:1264 length:582 start_codon:yes stop_codon:yes gene_type:complete
MINDKTLLQQKYQQGHEFDEFMDLADSLQHRLPWDERYGQLELTPEQTDLVHAFSRKMHVLCLTGTWCGDCALQGAAMARISQANPENIQLRYLQRDDEHAELIVKSQINAGFRVPVTWFLSEDFEPIACFGDRTLSRYRSMALKSLPPNQANVLASPPQNPVRMVLDEILEEFERIHLILRLSPRLRQQHGD